MKYIPSCSWNNHLILIIAREIQKRKSASIFSPKSYLNNQLRSCFFFCCTFMMNGRHKMHSNATIAQKAKPLFALESQVIVACYYQQRAAISFFLQDFEREKKIT